MEQRGEHGFCCWKMPLADCRLRPMAAAAAPTFRRGSVQTTRKAWK